MIPSELNDFLIQYVESTANISCFRVSVDGKILWSNPYFEKVLNYAAVNRDLSQIMRLGKDQNTESLLEKTKHKPILLNLIAKRNLPVSQYFKVMKLKDGDYFFIGQDDPDESERLQNEMIQLNTSLNNMSRELQKKNAELNRLDQVKNQFLGIAAHDLRNPIGAIMGYADVLLEDEDDSLQEYEVECLRKISQSSRFMLDLLEDLLDLTKIEAGKIELDCKQESINEIIKSNVSINYFLAQKKKIKIRFIPDAEDTYVDFDKSKIEQVLNNLISNGIKYSLEGTEMTISTFNTDGYVVVAVKDKGQGIPKDEIGNLFAAYKKTSVKSTAGEKSTGLGLAIVQKIIHAHKGRIWVESEVDEGSTFYFSLPLTNQENIPASKSEHKLQAKVSGDGIGVLYVDDDESQRMLLQMYLKKFNCKLMLAENGDEGLNEFKRSGPYDILFIDLEMPVKDGFETIKSIRKLEKESKVPPSFIVALSGHKDKAFQDKALDAGADQYILKPYSKKVILDLLAGLEAKKAS